MALDRGDLANLRIERAVPVTGRHRLRNWWLGLSVVAVLVAAGIGGLRYLANRPMAVQTGRVVLRGGAGGAGLTANGFVVARTKASISSKLPGRLAKLVVEEGDHVRKGEIIGELESAEYEAAVRQSASDILNARAAELEAQARRTQAQRDAERARALFQKSLTSEQSVQDAETALAAAQAQVEAAAARVSAAEAQRAAAEANLENTRIRAPFDGTVLRKDAEVGEVVAPSVAGGGLTRGAVVTMADLATLEVEVDVNEAYIAEIERGQPAVILLDAYPAESFRGHVRQIVPTADRQKATVLVRVALDTTDTRILPEMGARVVFQERNQVSRQPVVARVFVPAAAVRNEGGAVVVYVVHQERVERREIEAGPVSGGEREVRRGLSGGETVVVDPPTELVDGSRVRPVVKP